MSKLTPAQIELHQKLISSINDTQRHFDMAHWCTPGHSLDHGRLAAEIYETVTGVECPLDFHATEHSCGYNLETITRDEAILHINGEHPQWPLRDVA